MSATAPPRRIPAEDEVSHAMLVRAVAEILDVGSSASRVGLRKAAVVLGEVRRAIWSLPTVKGGKSHEDLLALLQPDDAGELHRPAR